MSRISKKFKELRSKNRKALIIFITAGVPDLRTTGSLILELERSGADIIELGIPFSDPLADGPIIQKSSQRSLRGGITLPKILKLVEDIRRKTKIPLVLMGYYNPILNYGEKRFIRDSAEAGADGLIIPDLPPEEGENIVKEGRARGLDVILFLAPTSTEERIKLIARMSQGFIYYISLTGVTGTRDQLADTIKPMVKKIRRFTDQPIAIGFGISNPKQAGEVAAFADGVILGSAVVNIIEHCPDKSECLKKVGKFVRSLKEGMQR
jgi:tryptophan synthase alpha chain